MSQDDLVKASGVSKGQISKLERADGPSARKLTREWAEKFAGPLQMPAERIMFWDKYGPPDGGDDGQDVRSEDVADSLPAPRRPAMVKLKGYVGAGDEAHYYKLADDAFEEVAAPRGYNDRTVALQIRGKSLGPLLDTWIVYYDDVRSPVTPDLHGEVCVVGLSDDRILVKKIKPEPGGTYRLLSNGVEPDIESATIEWAAKVTDMKPR